MEPNTTMGQQFLDKLIKIVDDNLHDESFGVSELAGKLGMSRATLHRKVKSIIKKSVSEFIREARLKRAYELLKNKSGTVAEVAFNVGFSSAAYFSKCFHDYYGFTPGEAELHQNDKSPEPDLVTLKPGKKRFLKILVYSFVLAVLATILFITIKPIYAPKTQYRLAILPFTDNSPDGEYKVINGIRAEIFNRLGSLDNLKLTSMVSSNAFYNTTLKASEIGKELKATHILTGDGETNNGIAVLRVYLIDVSTDEHIWEEKYKVDVNKNIQEIQETISLKISSVLKVELANEENYKTKKTDNPLALKWYTFGMDILNRKYYMDPFGGEVDDELGKAIKYLRYAIQEDPDFMDAYFQLAHIYLDYLWKRSEKRVLYLDTGKIMLDKYLSYNENDAGAYRLNAAYFGRIGEYEKAEEEFQKFLKLAREQGMTLEEYREIFEHNRFTHPCIAIEAFLKYLQLLPEDEPVYISRLMMFCGHLNLLGFPKVSRKYNKEVYRLNKDAKEYNLNMLNTYMDNRNYQMVLNYADSCYSLDTTKQYYKYYSLGAHLYLREYKKAAAYLPELIAYREGNGEGIGWQNYIGFIGFIYLKTGNEQVGKDYLEQESKRMEKAINKVWATYLIKVWLAETYSALGEKEKAFEQLRLLKNYDRIYSTQLYLLKYSPFFDNIRDEPEFKEIVQSIEDRYLPKQKCVEEVLREFGEIE